MSVNIDLPPASLSGDKNNAVLYDYLYRMSEQLNYALTCLDKGNILPASGEALQSGGAQSLLPGTKEADNLRALIVNTADIINRTIEKNESETKEKLTAVSNYGNIITEIKETVEKTAGGTKTINEKIETITSDIEALSNYRQKSEDYIQTGYLFDGLYGVAVGTISKTINDGKEEISRENLLATFTSTELAFWKNNKKVAYIASEAADERTGSLLQMLYIEDARILDSLYIGSYVFDTTDLGLEIKWEVK